MEAVIPDEILNVKTIYVSIPSKKDGIKTAINENTARKWKEEGRAVYETTTSWVASQQLSEQEKEIARLKKENSELQIALRNAQAEQNLDALEPAVSLEKAISIALEEAYEYGKNGKDFRVDCLTRVLKGRVPSKWRVGNHVKKDPRFKDAVTKVDPGKRGGTWYAVRAGKESVLLSELTEE